MATGAREAQEASPAPKGTTGLTLRQTLAFYLPVAASWLLMAFEGPIIYVFVNRLPETTDVTRAALGVVIGLSIWIESPVIGLLSTSTTLARNRQHYLQLRRFTIHLCLAVTFVAALVALTPLYDLIVRSWMNQPDAVADGGRIGMIIMIPWSAAIGWRRYTQGILIRHGAARAVGLGTVIRLVAAALAAGVLYQFSGLPGVWIGGFAWVSAVIAEAIYAHLAARPILAQLCRIETEERLDYRELLRFHLPLSITSMIAILGKPVIQTALSYGKNPAALISAYEMGWILMFPMRALGFALPEVVIRLQEEENSHRFLLKFCVTVGAIASLALLLLVLTPIGEWYLQGVLSLPADNAHLARMWAIAASPLPFLTCSQAWLRGMLTAMRRTYALGVSMGVYLASLIAFLLASAAAGWMDMTTPAIGVTAATLIETAVLYRFWAVRRGLR
jgi:hypothetical protein